MKKLMLSLTIATAVIFFISSCKEDEVIINNTEDFGTYLEEEMTDQKMAALSIVIFKEDEILYENYLGKSNIEQNASLESDNMFLLASISKVVTATALLQLHDDGLFDLEDNINDYLSFEVNIPNFIEDITFKMLLTHTSGIADGSALDNQYYYGEDSPVALGDFLEDYLSPSGSYYDESDNFYNFFPGSQHEYSNIGNALIGFLVEEISGMGFNEYCKEKIFNPIGMTNTSWRLDEITQTIVQPYNYESGEYESIQHYTFTDYPNGGLRSTGKDMFEFLSAFTQAGTTNGYQLLKAETIEAMISPQIPTLNTEVGLHLFIMDAANNLWGHDGGEEGVATIMAFNPDTNVGAIILSNQGEADLDEILVEAYKLGLEL